MKNEKQKIEFLEINKLIPYARNSRTHTDSQIAAIAASIKEFGWTNPVLIDEENMILAGHARILAEKLLREIEKNGIKLPIN